MEKHNSPETKEEKWRKYLATRMERNSNWIIPVISAISLGGISFMDNILSETYPCHRTFGYVAIILFMCSILSLASNLYFDIRWTSMLHKTKDLDEANRKYDEYNKSGKDHILQMLFDIAFWALVLGVFISIFFYLYVR